MPETRREPEIRWEYEAERALRAVYEGGLVCNERFGDRPGAMPGPALSITTKESARDVVTETDRRIEHHIRTLLAPCGHPVLGEEGQGENAVFPPAAGQPVWLVDPLDGTANFVAGMPWFAVSVGLWCDGVCVTGAVSLPATRELFFTHGDHGAFLNGKPLKTGAGNGTGLEEALIAASFSGTRGDPELRARHYALFGYLNDAGRGCLRLGSTAANIVQVAAGRLHAAYGLGARLWDAAGGLAVARQAGCALRLRLWPEDASRCDFVVGTPATVAAVAAAIVDSGAAPPLPASETGA